MRLEVRAGRCHLQPPAFRTHRGNVGHGKPATPHAASRPSSSLLGRRAIRGTRTSISPGLPCAECLCPDPQTPPPKFMPCSPTPMGRAGRRGLRRRADADEVMRMEPPGWDEHPRRRRERPEALPARRVAKEEAPRAQGCRPGGPPPPRTEAAPLERATAEFLAASANEKESWGAPGAGRGKGQETRGRHRARGRASGSTAPSDTPTACVGHRLSPLCPAGQQGRQRSRAACPPLSLQGEAGPRTGLPEGRGSSRAEPGRCSAGR